MRLKKTNYVVIAHDPTNTYLEGPVPRIIKASSEGKAITKAMNLDKKEAKLYNWSAWKIKGQKNMKL